MSDIPNKTAVDLLKKQAEKLVFEQKALRRTLFHALGRDREIDGLIADCIAGVRAFGASLEVPEALTVGVPVTFPGVNSTVAQHLRTYVNARHNLINQRAKFISDEEADPQPPEPQMTLPTLSGPMPTVSDIVIDRLTHAGNKGSKAASIQEFIETTYGKKMHDKTVGMTLYRLLKDKKVRRDGHTWFLAS